MCCSPELLFVQTLKTGEGAVGDVLKASISEVYNTGKKGH